MILTLLSILSLGLSSPLFAKERLAQKYIQSCDGLLEAVAAERAEDFFMDAVQSEAQVLQLLYDYGLIFTQEYQDAVLAAMNDFALMTPNKDALGLLGPDHLLTFLGQIQDLLGSPPLRQNQFVERVAGYLQQRAAVGRTKDPFADLRSQVSFSRVQNLFKAADRSVNRDLFYSTFGLVIRLTLLRTAQQAALKISPSALQLYSSAVSTVVTAGFRQKLIDMDPYISFQDTYGHYKQRRVRSLFNQYKRSMHKESLCLAEACEFSHVYDLTPAQLIYLGHMEILELDALRNKMIAAINAFRFNAGFNAIRSAALALKNDPKSPPLQAALRNAVFSFLQNFDQSKQSLRLVSQMLQVKLKIVQPFIHQFATLPARTLRLGKSAELTFKEQAIRNKISLELKAIREAKVNPQTILSGLDFFDVHRADFESVVTSTHSTQTEWLSIIDDILMNLDLIGPVEEAPL